MASFNSIGSSPSKPSSSSSSIFKKIGSALNAAKPAGSSSKPAKKSGPTLSSKSSTVSMPKKKTTSAPALSPSKPASAPSLPKSSVPQANGSNSFNLIGGSTSAAKPLSSAQDQGPEAPRQYDEDGNVINADTIKTQRQEFQDLGKELFGEYNPVTTSSLEEEISSMMESQKKEKEMQQKFSDFEQKQEQFGLDQQKVSGESAIAGMTAATAQSREGGMSAGNPMARDQFSATINAQMQMAEESYQLSNARRDYLMTQLDEAQKQGRMAKVIEVQNEIAAAEAAAAQAQTQMMEAQRAQLDQELAFRKQDFEEYKYETDQQGAMIDRSRQSVGTLKELIDSGSEMSLEGLQSLSGQLGLPMDLVSDFYVGAQSIRDNKNLTNEEKSIALQQQKIMLDRQVRGITNTELEKVDFVMKMYQSGASPEEIMQVKRIMGVKDEDDPMYRADLEIAQLDAEIKRKQMNGEPVTMTEQLALQEAQQKRYGLSVGGGSAYIPVKSEAGITTTFENGQLDVKFPPGTKLQCGAFVNRFWGARVVKDLYTDKQDLCTLKSEDANSDNVVPGMAFVMPIAGEYEKYGHIGIVAAPPDAQGNFKTLEFNAQGTLQYSEQVRNINQMYGFAPPPEGKANFKEGVAQQARQDSTVNWVDTLIENKYGGTGARKGLKEEKQKVFYDLLEKGRNKEAMSVATEALFKNATEKDQVMEARLLGSRYADVQSALNDFNKLAESAGVGTGGFLGTGLLKGNMDSILTKISAERPKEANVLRARLGNAFANYGKSISGAAMSDTERAELMKQFPSMTKDITANLDLIEELKRGADQTLDSKISGATNGLYGSADELNEAMSSIEEYGLSDREKFLKNPAKDPEYQSFVKTFNLKNLADIEASQNAMNMFKAKKETGWMWEDDDVYSKDFSGDEVDYFANLYDTL